MLLYAKRNEWAQPTGEEWSIPYDWRQYLYLEYITTGQENKYNIGRELQEEWPKIYNVEQGGFYLPAGNTPVNSGNILLTSANQVLYDSQGLLLLYTADSSTFTLARGNTALTQLLNSYTYFIDMLDPADIQDNPRAKKAIADITIGKIGRREKSVSEKGVNTVFNPMPPKIYYLETETPDLAKKRVEVIYKIINEEDGIEALLQVNDEYANDIAIGTASYSAYDCIRTELNNVLGYNEAITISCIPILGLEPNMRIYVKNEETHIDGDFMVNSITIPLAPNGTMSISANRIIERI